MPNHLVGKEPMPQKRYLYKKYPAWRYKPNCRPIIVHNQEEDDAIQAKGWHKTPKKQAVELMMESIPEDQRGDEKVVSAVEKMVETKVDSIAATTNMLLRVPKARKKKDLIDLADRLEIDLNGSNTLKKMKATILTEAEKMPELAKFLEAQKADEHRPTSH